MGVKFPCSSGKKDSRTSYLQSPNHHLCSFQFLPRMGWNDKFGGVTICYFRVGVKTTEFPVSIFPKRCRYPKKHTNKNNFHNALPSFVCLVQNRRHILISWRETSAGKHTIPSHPTQVSAGARFGQVGSPAIGHRVFDVWNMVKPRNMLVSPKRV